LNTLNLSGNRHKVDGSPGGRHRRIGISFETLWYDGKWVYGKNSAIDPKEVQTVKKTVLSQEQVDTVNKKKLLKNEGHSRGGSMFYTTISDYSRADKKGRTTPNHRDIPLHSRAKFASSRIRINRILKYRRRSERMWSNTPQKFVIIFTLLFTIMVISIAGVVGGIYAYYRSQLPLLDGIAQHALFQTTHIYDRSGRLLYDLYDRQGKKGRRTYINYRDISPLLIDATVSAEDHTFWNNTGVDYTSIARAAFTNIEKNGVVQGGSTITQQLIKNIFFQNQPRDVQIKGEEAVLAIGLTEQYPKRKIIEMYLNTVFYGDNNYGVEAAAQDFFNLKPQCDENQTNCKPAVTQLDLAQASLLAGLPQSPTSYNPVYYKDAALARQRQILSSMISLGYITAQQSEDAQKETQAMNFKPYGETHQPHAPHFVNYVIDHVLIPTFGAEALYEGGLNIYTTLDLDLEQKAEQLLYHHIYEPVTDQRYSVWYNDPGPLNQTKNVNDGAVMMMNPKNGEILVMDGSASTDLSKYTPEMQGDFNAAISPRQPGSSFKPFVYATAFEMGWYPAMIVNDYKTYYPNGEKPYVPQNADEHFHSGLGYPMTVRNALASSFNIPAIDAIEYAGIKNVVNMAGRLGLSEVTDNPANWVPSMAIGSIPISLLNMTDAYSTFANNGLRVPPVSILKITDNQNEVIYQYDEAHPQEVPVMRPEVAFLINSILSDKNARYHEYAPGNPMELDRPSAAKTGTTDMYRDNWTMGYTPDLVTGVWVGNSNNTPMHNVLGVTGAGPVWNELMTYALKHNNIPADDFTLPFNVHQAHVSAITGLAPQIGEPTIRDWFIDGSVPTVHNIDPPALNPTPIPIPTPIPLPTPDDEDDQMPQDY
jgi:membrane peptidoglycan carboxypeptidase